MSEPSIFTRIINGDIPCHKIYEDEHTFAFMDIHPVQEGMVVLTTKHQIDYFENVPSELIEPLFSAAQKITQALKHTYPAKKRIALKIEGLEVPHVHVVLYPINTAEDFRALPDQTEPDHAKLAHQAEQIRRNI